MFLIKIVFFLPKFVIETHRKCKPGGGSPLEVKMNFLLLSSTAKNFLTLPMSFNHKFG